MAKCFGELDAPASSCRASRVANKQDYAPLWQPSTAYAAAQRVLTPNGDIVICSTPHTSGASFALTTWAYAPKSLALTPNNGARPVGRGELMFNVKDYGAKGDSVAENANTLASGSYFQVHVRVHAERNLPGQ